MRNTLGRCSGCGSDEDLDTLVVQGRAAYCLRCRTCPHGTSQMIEGTPHYCGWCLLRPFIFRTCGRGWLLLPEALATLRATGMSLTYVLDVASFMFGDLTPRMDEVSRAVDRVWEAVGAETLPAGARLELPPAHLITRRHVLRMAREVRWRDALALVCEANDWSIQELGRVPSLRPREVGRRTG